MCGIAGMIDWKDSLEGQTSVFEAMQDTLHRRGPDQKGLYIETHAALIHTRLSVVDPKNGRQPMVLSQGNEEYVLIYNGELYNTSELRSNLEDLGHRFYGHSDTEVLLHAYVQWRDGCVEHLNGIFAFAVWEKHRQRIFVARDRIGVKPFFYVYKDGVFIFASEIKALLAHPMIEPEIDMYSIAEIMLIGPGRTPGYGIFRNVEELLPATCGYIDREGLRLRQYWKLKDNEHTDTFAQTVEKVRTLVTDSINRQLVSDVPVGTFLSGGVDSSIISSVAGRHLRSIGKELHTFSVDYKENERYFKASKFQPNSDNAYIDRMNRYLGASHHQILIDTDKLVEALYSAVDARDLPGMADVDASLLLFCKEVKKYVTVALSGECADEIFGGYPWYRDKTIREADGFPWAQSTAYRESFLLPDIASKIDASGYIEERYRETIAETSVRHNTEGTEKRMREMVNLNMRWFMQTLLDRKDRMSMYSGIEVRVPFCDYRIAEYLYAVPWEMKNYRDQEKRLLREAVRGLLPEEVLWRKKSPYPKTHHPAYLKAVSERLRELIADPNSPLLRIARKETLEALLQSNNSVLWYGQLMTTPQTIAYFLQINYWLKKYRIKIV